MTADGISFQTCKKFQLVCLKKKQSLYNVLCFTALNSYLL